MDNPLFQAWTAYALCVAAIGVAGVKLAVYGDAIACKTGLGGTWIGLVLMASVTSLPELAAGISAVTAAGVPDIAAGDVFGSCVYNLVILGIMDLFNILILALDDIFYLPGSLYGAVSPAHLVSASVALTMTGAVIVGLYVCPRFKVLGIAGWTSIFLFILYGMNSITLFHYGHSPSP